MEGFVVFCVKYSGYESGFLKFEHGAVSCKADASEATRYPSYKAAEAVVNALSQDKSYVYAEVLDAQGNPLNGDAATSATTPAPAPKYIRRPDK